MIQNSVNSLNLNYGQSKDLASNMCLAATVVASLYQVLNLFHIQKAIVQNVCRRTIEILQSAVKGS